MKHLLIGMTATAATLVGMHHIPHAGDVKRSFTQAHPEWGYIYTDDASANQCIDIIATGLRDRGVEQDMAAVLCHKTLNPPRWGGRRWTF